MCGMPICDRLGNKMNQAKKLGLDGCALIIAHGKESFVAKGTTWIMNCGVLTFKFHKYDAWLLSLAHHDIWTLFRTVSQADTRLKDPKKGVPVEFEKGNWWNKEDQADINSWKRATLLQPRYWPGFPHSYDLVGWWACANIWKEFEGKSQQYNRKVRGDGHSGRRQRNKPRYFYHVVCHESPGRPHVDPSVI